MYEIGKGVPKDQAVAISWYRKAADQGDDLAQESLGIIYQYGRGVPQDYSTAASWYRKAAEQGDASAQGRLGLLYSNGQGVSQDYVQAHKWLNLAASRSGADTDLHRMVVKNRDIIAAKMTPAQISKAQKLAAEWKPSLNEKAPSP
jgi:hypothetical protein